MVVAAPQRAVSGRARTHTALQSQGKHSHLEGVTSLGVAACCCCCAGAQFSFASPNPVRRSVLGLCTGVGVRPQPMEGSVIPGGVLRSGHGAGAPSLCHQAVNTRTQSPCCPHPPRLAGWRRCFLIPLGHVSVADAHSAAECFGELLHLLARRGPRRDGRSWGIHCFDCTTYIDSKPSTRSWG